MSSSYSHLVLLHRCVQLLGRPCVGGAADLVRARVGVRVGVRVWVWVRVRTRVRVRGSSRARSCSLGVCSMPSAPSSGPVVGAFTRRVSTATTETCTTIRWPVVARPGQG